MTSDTAIAARIVHRSGHPVHKLILNLRAPYTFVAGQYLEVMGRDRQIPLYMEFVVPGLIMMAIVTNSYSNVVSSFFGSKFNHSVEELLVSPARGDVFCSPADTPLLLVAGGSGAAQAFSCAEQRSLYPSARTSMLWCADHAQEIYDVERLTNYLSGQLEIHVDQRRTAANEGMVWLQAHAARFEDHHVIISGSPGFVYAVTDLLLAQGYDTEALASDVYAYAPRL